MNVYYNVHLTLYQEKVLLYRFIRKRCIFSAYKIIFFYLKLVFKVSYKFSNYNIGFFDVFNEGLVGLVNAVLYYNPEKNYKFVNFVFLWVRFAILNYIRTRSVRVYINKEIYKNCDFLFECNENFFLCRDKDVFFRFLDKKYQKYKVKSALHYILPVLQTVVFGSYVFNRLLSLSELGFLLNSSVGITQRLRMNALNILYILSI